MRFPVDATIACSLMLLLSATAAGAQERFFVGPAVLLATDDHDRRERLSRPGSIRAWSLEGGLFVNPHIGISVEVFRPGTLRGATGGRFGNLQIRQDEIALLANVRSRAVRRGVGLDLLGGIGPLRQRRVLTLRPLGSTAAERETITARSSFAFVMGIDVNLPLMPHLSLAPTARVYWFTREGSDAVRSGRFALGSALRARW